ncbi:MAG: hypothetical protein KBT01_01185 [Clostridiales bacterium]|nr:hypothetical protein [Candidatus Blautia equi]
MKKRWIPLLIAMFLVILGSTSTWAVTPREYGMVKDPTGKYYFIDYKMLKNQWKVSLSQKYYFGSDGRAVTGPQKIDGRYYFFDAEGVLQRPEKERMMKYGSYYYIVNPNGTINTGWILFNNNLYYGYFRTNGALFRNRTYLNVTLGNNGAAVKNNYTVRSKIEALKLLKEITKDSWTREQKLRAAFNFLSSRDHVKYSSKYDPTNIGVKGWQHQLAYQFLVLKKGTCSGFNTAFAAVADVLGWNSKILRGRVIGKNGWYVDHTWLTIDGKFYDPETAYTGTFVCFGLKKYPVKYTIEREFDYRTYY